MYFYGILYFLKGYLSIQGTYILYNLLFYINRTYHSYMFTSKLHNTRLLLIVCADTFSRKVYDIYNFDNPFLEETGLVIYTVLYLLIDRYPPVIYYYPGKVNCWCSTVTRYTYTFPYMLLLLLRTQHSKTLTHSMFTV